MNITFTAIAGWKGDPFVTKDQDCAQKIGVICEDLRLSVMFLSSIIKEECGPDFTVW
jgi:hypothetical protein